jgi:hypothetical protein
MISSEDESFLIAQEIQPVIQFVQQALLSKNKGNSSHYNHIVAQLNKRDDSELIWRLLVALTSSISSVTQR